MSEGYEVITFKVNKSLLNLMKGVQNRSEFIREAILAAVQNVCPLCKGVGVLNPKRKEHWDEFANHHRMTECDDCDEVKIECVKKK